MYYPRCSGIFLCDLLLLTVYQGFRRCQNHPRKQIPDVSQEGLYLFVQKRYCYRCSCIFSSLTQDTHCLRGEYQDTRHCYNHPMPRLPHPIHADLYHFVLKKYCYHCYGIFLNSEQIKYQGTRHCYNLPMRLSYWRTRVNLSLFVQ